MRLVWLLAFAALVFAACSGRRLPPGTPPPEYEPPLVTAWPPATGDAGIDAPAAANATRGAEAQGPPTTEPELSLDAGSR